MSLLIQFLYFPHGLKTLSTSIDLLISAEWAEKHMVESVKASDLIKCGLSSPRIDDFNATMDNNHIGRWL